MVTFHDYMSWRDSLNDQLAVSSPDWVFQEEVFFQLPSESECKTPFSRKEWLKLFHYPLLRFEINQNFTLRKIS